MNYEEAIKELKNGHSVRLPEWRGYWILRFSRFVALTKDGEYKPALRDDPGVKNRTDWEIANGLDFGWAITALKNGKLVTRKSWNGKGMFIFIRPADNLPAEMVVNTVKSLPKGLKDYISNQFKGDFKKSSDGSPFTIQFTSYICMKAADETIVNGWLASQTDMLAEDWELFEY